MSEVVCSRCKTAESVLVARKENFCAACFVKFLRGKQRKHMSGEKYKVKYGNKEKNVTKVLLCLSFGKSSLSLLDMIISSFKEQADMHKGRQGYHLTCLVVLNKQESAAYKQKMKSMSEAYQLQDLQVSFRFLDINSYIPGNNFLHKLKLYNDFDTLATKNTNFQNLAKLTVDDLLSLCPQRTTKEDLLDIIHHDLYIKTAIAEGFDTLLLGHSMTKLADDIISLTVKGRGAMINERLTDGLVIEGTEIEVIHPLRDILQTEIDKYSEFTGVDKFAVESTDTNSKRMTKYKTVNELTRSYFENLDKDYSEVISTVVKIGSKLTKPEKGSGKTCQICGETIYKDPKSWLTKITVNEAAPLTTEEESDIYKIYQDSRADEDEKVGTAVDICYGCTVSLGEVKTGLVWPEREQQILNEYILTDDED